MSQTHFLYNIGDKHNKLTILSIPYKKDPKAKLYYVDLECECGYKYARCTRYFSRAKECRICTSKRVVQKVIAQQVIKEIPIGSRYEHLIVNGKCFRYKGGRRLPVICDCGLKYEIDKKSWEKIGSCHKCRPRYYHDIQYDEQEGTKKCSICGKIKSLSMFGTDNKNKTTGKRSDCKECQSFTQKIYKFGLTKEQLEQMIEEQNNKCLICGLEFQHYSEWCIDHCHHTGKIRGILCSECNTGLGYFFDNTEFLKNAIAYLEKPLDNTTMFHKNNATPQLITEDVMKERVSKINKRGYFGIYVDGYTNTNNKCNFQCPKCKELFERRPSGVMLQQQIFCRKCSRCQIVNSE
jgi:hypothetical protein